MRHIQIPPCVRHFSIIIDNTDVEDRVSFEHCNENLSALDKRLKVEHLRTLMLFGDYHGSFVKNFGGLLREATALRVIFLSEASYNLEDILHNFSKLVHLHYLRIKSSLYCQDLCLPSALFRLYHLEIIDLQSVQCRVSSTRNISNLVKLHHFLLPKNMLQFHSDIYGVGKLKFLQELRNFNVGKESDGFELSQLGPLTELGGSLGIYNLENVQTEEEANESKLLRKNHLRELILQWGSWPSNNDPVKEDNVLRSLVPHSNLQDLCIRGHGGTNCPAWLCENLSVKCLESLCLDNVSWKNLPPLGEMWMVNEHGEEYQCCSISSPGFHNLKRLQLSNIYRLKKWVGNDNCSLFSHLEVLIIKDCSELMELPFSHPTCSQAQQEKKMAWFPRLRELVIFYCPKLVSMPSIPWWTGAPCSAQLERVGTGIEQLVYPSYGKEFSLGIEGKGGEGDEFWSGLNFSNLTDLEKFHMKIIPFLSLDKLRVLTSLKKIDIEGVSSVLPPVDWDWYHGMYRFPVEVLHISRCDASGKELTLLLSFLPNLSELFISECKIITGLGVVEDAETVSREQEQQTRVGEEEIIIAAAAQGLLFLPSQLQELMIYNCSNVSLLANSSHDNHTEAGGGLQRLRCLRSLWIDKCPEFLSSYSSSLISSFLPFPTCLQDLDLLDVKHMETLQPLSNLTSLTGLMLRILGGSTEEGLWPLLAHGHLTKLHLYADSDFFAGFDPSRPHDKEVFACSSKLFYLCTEINTGFLAAPICSLLSSTLTKLYLSFGTEMERLTKEQEEALQLLTSLQELEFSCGFNLQRLPAGLHNLINLEKLQVESCDDIKSLPSLPSSLQELVMEHCHATKSLPNALPISLEILRICHCDAIKSLPKNGLPSLMLELDVLEGNSEELKRACHKLIGTIPIVRA
ncbi:hypothetical protein CFC21_025561 [Triticum aestivum]|uniref:R13L1/DRL21-like LRR repeat region domain-containing protein n=3 Tax=Triticum aestivum TaxID=4565 RepID=A0A3B6CFR3_WHEAT|nr:hypothetical protein CFC21_025561 [Triticum aestivum]